MRKALYLILFIATASPTAAHAGERGAARMSKAVLGTAKKNEKIRFVGDVGDALHVPDTRNIPEVWKTSTTKRGKTLRVYRLSARGLQRHRTLTELENGTVLDGKVVLKNEIRDGVIHTQVQLPPSGTWVIGERGNYVLRPPEPGVEGYSYGYTYDPKTGNVTQDGSPYADQVLHKGLSAAEAYHQLKEGLDRRQEDD
jgi:hypothetical protein